MKSWPCLRVFRMVKCAGKGKNALLIKKCLSLLYQIQRSSNLNFALYESLWFVYKTFLNNYYSCFSTIIKNKELGTGISYWKK
jgi:hypothetical protein